jgi:cell division protein DivIC
MLLKNIKQHRYLKHLFNPYISVTLVFAIWMLFFDDNSFLFHQELNTIINEKKAEIKLYQVEIEKDKKDIRKLNNEDHLESFAREKYYMKKDNEEIYIIEYENNPSKNKKL